jgi:hypothetical protein
MKKSKYPAYTPKPLSQPEVIKIKRIIDGVFKDRPEDIVAERLRDAGFTDESMWLFTKTPEGQRMDSSWTTSVQNSMSTFERLKRRAGE